MYAILTDIFTTSEEVKEPNLETENNSSVILEKPSSVSQLLIFLTSLLAFFSFYLPFILPF